mgnify:CR=1 FL=1
MKHIIYISIVINLVILCITKLNAQTKLLSIEDIFQAAATGNKDVQIKLLEKHQAESVKDETKSSMLPTVFLNSSYTFFTERPVIYLRDETLSPKANPVKYNGSLALDAAITANYNLTNSVVKKDIILANIETDKKDQEKNLVTEQLALQLSKLYYHTLFLKQQEKVLLQSIDRNKKALFDAKNLFYLGKSLKTDTLSYSIIIHQIQNSLSSLNNQIHINLLQLKQLCGYEENMNIDVKGDLAIDEDSINKLENDTSNDVSFSDRPDIKLATLSIQSSQNALKRFKALYQPALMAFAQYQVQSQADNFRFRDYTLPRTSFLGLKLQVPIYSGKRFHYQTNTTRIQLKKKELEHISLKEKIKTEQATLRLQLIDEIKKWQLQQKSIDAAQEAYQIIYERYQFGLSNRIELSDAELALTKSKLEEKSYAYRIKVIETELRKSFGKLNL